ncbi:UDP-N-acetylglucosamine 2-epimerase (non-hydrolyzing) [Flavicella sp.]|uniref:non-hydrolyzing UDP-N-acetylglucosamine 2-epimerase n=1 Tax=Flavicella sp. TaxID=2957742 RepID=UPI0030195A29
MKKIVTILGARPQFVKAAVLSREIQKNQQINEVIVHTGQHYDANMSDVFFVEMEIPKPKYNLDVNGVGHGAMTGQMLEKIEAILLVEKPDAVVVYGDTNSTFAGALAAQKLQIKVVHIEAGLRSFNMKMPEEVNRTLTDRISNLLLCPTETAMTNLKKEGYDQLDIDFVICGDIMKDAVLYYGKISSQKSTIIEQLGLKKNEFVLATIHRQENTDSLSVLTSIFEGLTKIHGVKKVIMPLHPRTKNILENNKLEYPIEFIEPVGYFDMLELLKNCNLVVTDSGGLQKEAFFNKKYCLVAREQTEWVELVSNGFAKLIGSSSDQMVEVFYEFQTKENDFSIELFGNHVGEKIHKAICNLIQD